MPIELDIARNLWFGAVAVQAGLVDLNEFVDAIAAWAGRKSEPLANILRERGVLLDEDRQHVEYLLDRRLVRVGGDGQALASTLPEEIKSALTAIVDDDIRRSFGSSDDSPSGTELPRHDPPQEERPRHSLRVLHSIGGIGKVWIAHDNALDREVALKELKAESARSAASRERFFREARLTAQLQHPGIVPVYQFHQAEDDDSSYYTMRFVRGRTLSDLIRERHAQRGDGGLGDLVPLLQSFVALCQTVAYAHSRRVIHRDLKGDNVMVGDFGEVILLDWGLAKKLGDPPIAPDAEAGEAADHAARESDPLRCETLDYNDPVSMPVMGTMQGAKLGTPPYMAPEQAQGRIDLVDERTDVYGLAAILYEILAGEPPFLGKTVAEVLNRAIHDPPRPPSELAPATPPELESLCLEGLAKDRDARPQSAAELAARVLGWIAGQAERKRTERERVRFFELSVDLLAIADGEGRLVQSNPAWERALGWSADELAAAELAPFLHPDGRERFLAGLADVLAGGPWISAETRCRHKDGSFRWIHWSATHMEREQAVYLVGRDITERKQAERTLHDLLESAPDAMVVVDRSGRIVLANAQLQRLFGFSREELLGQPIEVLVPVEHRGKHPGHVARFFSSPEARPMASGLKLQGRHKLGRVFAAEISLSPVETDHGRLVSCAVRDVTAQRKEEAKIQALLDGSPDGVVVVDAGRVIRLVNRRTEELFGHRREDLLGKPLETLLPERHREGHAAHFARFVAEPSRRSMGSGRRFSALRKDGAEFPAEISLSPIETEDGLLVSCAIRDLPAAAPA